MKLVDLHIHSTSSDGIFKPGELVNLAAAAGLSTIAIADHDAISGIAEAEAAAAAAGITLIPAVELSVEYGSYHDVHLLGYYIDHTDTLFNDNLLRFRRRRETRGVQVIENINRKLQSEGKPAIDVDNILATAEGSLGRPHIARALIDQGLASDMQEAFNAYLVPCNVPKEYFPFTDAIAEIHRVGGIAVLAHPQSISREKSELVTVITAMAAIGLDGIEAFNSMGYEGDDAFLKQLANSLDLIVTGGSDFHGGDEGLQMGKGRGNLLLTQELVAGMIRRRERYKTSPA